MSGKERFLDRWSRLKQTEEPPEAEAPEPPTPVEDDRSDEEILADLGLPHPDDLEPGDDVTGFMAKTVPDRLRRMALRQLWRSNPVLANVDGLVEYGEDYTDSAMVVENLQTLYQVGKGMFTEPEEVDKEPALEEEAEPPKDADPTPSCDDRNETQSLEEPQPPESLDADTERAPDDTEPGDEIAVVSTKRRMVFR